MRAQRNTCKLRSVASVFGSAGRSLRPSMGVGVAPGGGGGGGGGAATPAVGGLSEGECHMDPSCLGPHNPPPMEKQKWWGQDSGLADLRERIDPASCGEEQTGDCPGPCKETTDGLEVTQGGLDGRCQAGGVSRGAGVSSGGSHFAAGSALPPPPHFPSAPLPPPPPPPPSPTWHPHPPTLP